MEALIGATGFIGSNLRLQSKFDYEYSSKNLSQIERKVIDLLIIAAPGGSKIKVNQNPCSDLQDINQIITSLSTVKARYVVYLSTVDIYSSPQGVTEKTPIISQHLHPYGLYRYKLENFIQNKFSEHLIIRLPNVFGFGLKKNFMFDLLDHSNLHFTHKDSFFQFYCLSNLWKDIQIARKNNIRLINFAVEPMMASEISQVVIGKPFKGITEKDPLNYDVRSCHARIYSNHEYYLYSKKDVILQMCQFLHSNS